MDEALRSPAFYPATLKSVFTRQEEHSLGCPSVQASSKAHLYSFTVVALGRCGDRCGAPACQVGRGMRGTVRGTDRLSSRQAPCVGKINTLRSPIRAWSVDHRVRSILSLLSWSHRPISSFVMLSPAYKWGQQPFCLPSAAPLRFPPPSPPP